MKTLPVLKLVLALVVVLTSGSCSENTTAPMPGQASPVASVGEPGAPPPQVQGETMKLTYILTVDGEIVDGADGGQPLEVAMGTGQTIPAFEQAIAGLKPGDRKSFEISAKDGFGAPDPNLIQEVPRAQLPQEMTPEPGLIIEARTTEGEVRRVTITAVRDDVVVIDFNHPLAGKTLNFEVEILEAD